MNETTALDRGIASANPELAHEAADVKAWFDKYDKARRFDKEARRQYARDRRYARGDSGAVTDANIVGTHIDILESFLYARDPDVDVLPAVATEPPSLDAIRDAAEGVVENDPQVKQAEMIAFQAVLAETGNEQTAMQAGQVAGQAVAETLIQAQFDAIQERYAKQQRDNKAYAETIEIIIAKLWKDAALKDRGRKFTRAGLTIGVGGLKAFWDERTAPAPETVKAINDLQDNIKRAAAKRAEIAERNPGVFERIAQGFKSAIGMDVEAELADYNRQLEALSGQAERIVARGFVIESVRADDLQVAPGVDMCDYLDAPWISQDIYMPYEDACARTKIPKEMLAKATRYAAKKPVMRKDSSAVVDNVDAKDADAFEERSSGSTMDSSDEGGDWVKFVEFWDRTSSSVLTGIAGVECWAKPKFQPKATTRFYPFFLLCMTNVDGQRHPQSMTSRLAKLADEYNRIGDAEREHRMRIKPKMLFLKGQIGGEAMTKVVEGEIGEYVGVETANPNIPLSNLFFPCAYPQIDPALYDRSRIVAEMERVSGIQEALSGSINVAKTATEAEIQQSGFQARTGGRRDLLEGVLQELAQYTAETARACLTDEDVRRIAGPDAMWPDYAGAADLNDMVNIEIRAGSSGKPNTSAERQAWQTTMPLLTAAIDKIGMLRNSTPSDLADCHEDVVRMTAERSGERMDVDAMIPKPGPAPLAMPGVGPDGQPLPTGAPAAPGEPSQGAIPAPPLAA